MLELYRSALRIRRTHPALGDGVLRWLETGPGVLSFAREPGFCCVLNLSAVPVALPPHSGVLLASGDLADGLLPADEAIWLRTS
jgi:alpha-glucosidase